MHRAPIHLEARAPQHERAPEASSPRAQAGAANVLSLSPRMSAQRRAIAAAYGAATVQRVPVNIGDPTSLMDGMHLDTQTATKVTAVMKDADDGGAPSVAPPGWAWLQNKLGKIKGSWVRFHIINQYLGGPGNKTWNLVPASVAVNNAYNQAIEEDAKKSANTNSRWTYVEVDLAYNATWPPGIPATITGAWGLWDGAKWVQKRKAAFNNPDVMLLGTGMNYMRGVNITQAQMIKRGVPASQVKAFTDWLKSYSQSDEDDNTMLNAADDFGFDNAAAWLKQIWLDESDTTPGDYVPVVKAL
jgi:hypothetical protein